MIKLCTLYLINLHVRLGMDNCIFLDKKGPNLANFASLAKNSTGLYDYYKAVR